MTRPPLPEHFFAFTMISAAVGGLLSLALMWCLREMGRRKS